jgi:ABC-type polysaccharide/polyol phosphate export permease
MYMMFSWFFCLADWLPPPVRRVALYQPFTRAYEMIHAGVFGRTIKTYGDLICTSCVLAVLTLCGLSLLREGQYAVAE